MHTLKCARPPLGCRPREAPDEDLVASLLLYNNNILA